MNLFYLVQHNDRLLQVEGELNPAKQERNGDLWRGLEMNNGATLTIPGIRRFAPFRAFPAECGWFVETPARKSLTLSFVDSASGAIVSSREFSGAFQQVTLPWPHMVPGVLDLRIEVSGRGRGAVFLAVHRALSRQWLLDLAKGRGVEIGPGPQPQILPADNVDVSYVEEMPPDEWNRLYNASGKFDVRSELWSNYVIGTASKLPADRASLDFIFASHVFEHLANPIGHLRHWRKKLARGGRVICIVPDFAGSKDAHQYRSSMQEWLSEFEERSWRPSEAHYARHFRRKAGDKLVQEAMARGESIHVHHYDNINCQWLLEYAVRNLGYADYVIEHTPNHKDFHFVLRNR